MVAASHHASPDRSPRIKVGNLRWKIVGMFGVFEFVNYMDRINLSVAGTLIGSEFGLDAATLGIAFSAFLWSYGLMMVPVGLLLDRYGVKRICRISVIGWACATFLTAAANGLGLIIVARLLLGVTESAAFPAAMKATGHWFPRTERGLATAIFSAPGRLSNVIGAPLVGLAIGVWGWRGAFITTGILTVIFSVWFWLFYRDPSEKHATGKLSQNEYDYIRAGRPDDEHKTVVDGRNLLHVIRQRKVLGLAFGLACAGYLSWIMLTWLPSYFQMTQGASAAMSGVYTAIPWAVAVCVEFIIAGYLVDRLVKRGHDETRVRKTVLISGMLLACTVAGIGLVDSFGLALLLITFAVSGIALAFSVSNSLPALIAPPGQTGTVGSFMNFVNIMAGAIAPIVTGLLVDATGSFAAGFILAGAILLVGIFFYTVVMGRIEQIPAIPDQDVPIRSNSPS